MLTNREQRLLTIALWLALALNVGMVAFLIAEGVPSWSGNLVAAIMVGVALWLRRQARQRSNSP